MRTRGIVPGSANGGLRMVSTAQGLFYVAGAGWALVDIRSFEAVTGPKVDEWLVKTVALLLIVSATIFLMAACRQRVSSEVIILAIGNALALTAIDVVYVSLRRISPIYLLDAAAHVALLAGWSLALWRSRRNDRWQSVEVRPSSGCGGASTSIV